MRPKGSDCGDGFDDDVRYRLRSLVRETKDLAGQRHDSNVRTVFEYIALVLGQRTIALLGMYDPRWDAGFAQPPIAAIFWDMSQDARGVYAAETCPICRGERHRYRDSNP